jgi:hypothetical protein
VKGDTVKLAVVSLAFAFSSFGLAAQGAPQAGYGIYRFGAVSNGCPVSMRLQQTLSHQLQTVQNGKLVRTPATQLTLTLGVGTTANFGIAVMQSVDPNKQPSAPAKPARLPAQVAFATATVHGFGAGPEFELVSPAAGQNVRGNRRPAPQKSLKLQFNSKDGSRVADIWLARFGPVRWLDLDTITYSDGSTWKPAKGQTCSVAPDPFMLVGADSASAPASK